MAKFLIEVPHGADKTACDQAIQVFLQTGSHFLTHADWGCLDGEHKAWIIADVRSKDDARYDFTSCFQIGGQNNTPDNTLPPKDTGRSRISTS